jgi:hypothetical protein
VAENPDWWKNYYVRYFLGTAFAIPLVLVLSKNVRWIGDLGDFSQKPWMSAVVVSFGGLAFCYAASAPILVFHSVRSAIWQKANASRVAVYFLLAASTSALIAAFIARFAHFTAPDWALAIPFAAVVALQIACLFVLATRLDTAQKFYSHLAKLRADSPGVKSARSEYVESYRHLREHGNAFSILSMEITLTLALIGLGQSKVAFAFVLLAWILPSTIAWIVGTSLEAAIDKAR